MTEYEFSGKTVEEAVENGLKTLGLTKEEAEIRVLEEGKKGGLFSKGTPARVAVSKKKTDGERANRLIYRLAREGCKVIFLTEPVYAQCSEAINKFKTETFPAIIPIPDSHGPSGVAMAAIKANVEKAIGADILFSEDK